MKISIDSSSLVSFVSSSLFIVFEGNERKRKEDEKREKRKGRRGTLILWNVTEQRLTRRALRSSFSSWPAGPIDPRQKGIGPTDGWRSLAPPRSSFECNYSCIDIPSVLHFFPPSSCNHLNYRFVNLPFEITRGRNHSSLSPSPIIHPFPFSENTLQRYLPHYLTDHRKFIIRGIKHGAY